MSPGFPTPVDQVRPALDLPRPTFADAVAGVSVALVLIPQSLAYAGLAGMPAYIGLFAAALPLLIFALFASSPYLQTGPVALTSLLTFGALESSGFIANSEPDAATYVAAGAVLAVMVGVIRLALGAFRLGGVAYLICEPVMIGFMSGAAIVIMSSQLPKVFGVLPPDDYGTLRGAGWALANPGRWESAALVLSAITMALMLGGRKVHKLFPGVLIAVVIGLTYSLIVDYTGPVVLDDGEIPPGLPSVSFDLPWGDFGSLLVGAFVIALVGFAEPASIARTFANEERSHWNASRELFSSGLANIVSGASGAFPVGGSFSRSSVNKFAGAQTRWSGGITGLVVLAFLPFARVLEQLPKAVLGAIVVGAVLGLIRPVRLVKLWQRSWSQAALAWVTFIATLITTPRIERAIALGVVLTVLHHFMLKLRVDTAPSPVGPEIAARPVGLLWIGSQKQFGQRLASVIEDHPDQSVELDLSDIPAIDAATVDVIAAHAEDLATAGHALTWINAPDGADAMLRSAIYPDHDGVAQ